MRASDHSVFAIKVLRQRELPVKSSLLYRRMITCPVFVQIVFFLIVNFLLIYSLSACAVKTLPEEREDNDDLISLVQKASVEQYKEWRTDASSLFPDDGNDIPVVIASDGEDTWALAWCYREGLDGHSHTLVWRIKSIDDNHIPILLFLCNPALSPGLSADVFEYDDKFLVFGELSEYHWDPRDQSRIDLSARSYLIIETQTGNTRVPADNVIYVCILDSAPIDIVLYDNNDKELLRVSEWEYLKGYVPRFVFY